jgi:hypothetical protein
MKNKTQNINDISAPIANRRERVSKTAGANGAIFLFPLSGGITTYMTGIGVHYPDGTCMQRAGVKIDKEIKPTIDGIKKGKDEPLEKAIKIVKEKFIK